MNSNIIILEGFLQNYKIKGGRDPNQTPLEFTEPLKEETGFFIF